MRAGDHQRLGALNIDLDQIDAGQGRHCGQPVQGDSFDRFAMAGSGIGHQRESLGISAQRDVVKSGVSVSGRGRQPQGRDPWEGVESQVLQQVIEGFAAWFQRDHTTLGADQTRRLQAVEADVCADINENVSGPEQLVQLAQLRLDPVAQQEGRDGGVS